MSSFALICLVLMSILMSIFIEKHLECWTVMSIYRTLAALLIIMKIVIKLSLGDYDLNQTNDERKLVDYLMRNYDNNIRPVRDASNPVIIRLGITLTQIFDLDEKNQVLTTNVWLDQEWIDEFLYWNSSDYGNLTKIRIPCEKIWKPDIVLYNSADDYTRGYMNSRAMIEPNGNVFWPPPTKFRSTCPVDVTYFPFDDQTCIMKLGSWIYDGLQVDVLNRTAEVDLSNYVANGEWDLIEAHLIRNVVVYPCCPEPFPDVTVTVVIRRKILYYMYNVILPCMMMSILTLLVFCLPPDSGEKIALGVTVLLAFSVFMLAISEKLPETSESIPLLGVYLTAVMGITSVSIVMTVIVLNFHYRGPVRKEMPKWLKKLILDKSIYKEYYKSTTSGNNNRSAQQKKYNMTNNTTANSSNTWHTSSSSCPYSSHLYNTYNLSTTSTATYGISTKQSVLRPHLIKSAADAMLRGIVSGGSDSSASQHNCSSADDNTANDALISRIHQITSIAAAGSDNNVNNVSNNNSSGLNEQLIANLNEANAKRNANKTRTTTTNTPSNASDSMSAKMSSQEELSQILRYLLWRQDIEDQHNRMVHEWRLLALAVDKVLFWVFFVITLASSLSFLVIIPIQRRGFPF